MRVLGQLGWELCGAECLSTWLGCVGVREHHVPLPLLQGDCHCHGRKDGACRRSYWGEGLLLGLWETCFSEGAPHMPLGTHCYQAAGASRKQFSHPVRFPKYRKQWWSARGECFSFTQHGTFWRWAVLLTDPLSAHKSSLVPQSLYRQRSSMDWDFLIADPLWLASVVGGNNYSPH